jgi:hypothetical protein
MIDRGYRHHPLSTRYIFYLDHRPMLPQETGLLNYTLRKTHDSYQNIFYYFKNNKETKIILSNNIPVEDREKLKKYGSYINIFNKNLDVMCLGAAYLFTVSLFSVAKSPLIWYKIIFFLGSFSGFKYLLKSETNLYDSHIYNYYFQKHKNVFVNDINDINDPRRKFFRPDTSEYYRESAQEIYDKKSPEKKHDPAIYYGPHPYNDYENVQSLIELNRKFLDGHSSYDDNELIFGEKIDIDRKIRGIPTIQEYKEI